MRGRSLCLDAHNHRPSTFRACILQVAVFWAAPRENSRSVGAPGTALRTMRST